MITIEAQAQLQGGNRRADGGGFNCKQCLPNALARSPCGLLYAGLVQPRDRYRMQARLLPNAAAALALLVSPLCGCSVVGMGFDKYDGRWVANVPPAGDCCPTHVVLDVDGHEIVGSVEDCNGVASLKGTVQDSGHATVDMSGKQGTVQFSGVNFTATVPNDRCGRAVVGNRGG